MNLDGVNSKESQKFLFQERAKIYAKEGKSNAHQLYARVCLKVE